MKKQKVQAKINLEALAGGAFAEKLNEALMQVAENIQNPNTEATTKRQITVNIKFTPNKTRQMVGTQIAVTTKLAATEAIDTQMVMGVNMRTGQIEIAEYDGQIRGQMDLSDFTDADQDQEPEETQAAAPTPGQNPTGKPLDLKNRGKQAPAAAAELVPGRDYDPDTGEVYETTGQSADDRQTTSGRNNIKVVKIAPVKISIHAPAKGATSVSTPPILCSSFEPSNREPVITADTAIVTPLASFLTSPPILPKTALAISLTFTRGDATFFPKAESFPPMLLIIPEAVSFILIKGLATICPKDFILFVTFEIIPVAVSLARITGLAIVLPTVLRLFLTLVRADEAESLNLTIGAAT